MTIHTTPLYGIAYCDADTPLVDLATASQQAATTTDAALQAGGVVPPGAADLTAEAATRASADAALSTRLTAVEPGAWTALTAATGLAVYTGTAGAAPATMTGPYDVPGVRKEGSRGYMRGWMNTTTATGAGQALDSVAIPTALRPTKARALWPRVDGAPPATTRVELGTDGIFRLFRAVATGQYLNFDGLSWDL